MTTASPSSSFYFTEVGRYGPGRGALPAGTRTVSLVAAGRGGEESGTAEVWAEVRRHLAGGDLLVALGGELYQVRPENVKSHASRPVPREARNAARFTASKRGEVVRGAWHPPADLPPLSSLSALPPLSALSPFLGPPPCP